MVSISKVEFKSKISSLSIVEFDGEMLHVLCTTKINQVEKERERTGRYC